MRHALPLAALLAAALLVAPGLVEARAHDTSDAIAAALAWLRTQQTPDGHIGGPDAGTAWTAIAFARAGVDPGTVRQPGGASLRDAVVADTAALQSTGSGNDFARQVLALVASGADPHVAAGYDVVARMVGLFDGTQYADPTLVNDDVFFLQALEALGYPSSDPMVQAERAFLESNQLPSGAWSYGALSVGNPDLPDTLLFADSDTTGQAIVALSHSGSAPSEPHVVRGLGWIKATQGVDGGCTWSPVNIALSLAFAPQTALESNGDSTSWVTMGVRAARQDPQGAAWTVPVANNLIRFLLSLQEPDGQFDYQQGVPGDSGTTPWIVVALSGHDFVV